MMNKFSAFQALSYWVSGFVVPSRDGRYVVEGEGIAVNLCSALQGFAFRESLLTLAISPSSLLKNHHPRADTSAASCMHLFRVLPFS